VKANSKGKTQELLRVQLERTKQKFGRSLIVHTFLRLSIARDKTRFALLASDRCELKLNTIMLIRVWH
jgi:hypothetical protein